jgi:hypothetical protein
MGLSVIPLKPKSKVPLLTSWKEFQTRKASEEEIRSWFAKTVDANIGIVTGIISGIVVIDLDGKEGSISASQIGIKSRVLSLTGSGKHLFFKYNGEEPTRIWKGNGEHEEVFLRSTGEYIVAPPSIHPNGKRYRWLNPSKRPVLDLLPLFPQNLLLNVNYATVNTDICKQEDWIEEALEDFKNGHVANTLVSILGKFRAHNFTENATFAFLSPHNTSGKMSQDELKEKISEIFGRYEPLPQKSIVVHKDIESDESVDEFLQEEEKPEWFVEGLFAKKTIGFFAGLPESGKTWALMDLAIEVATGGNWLGLFPVKKSKVLFIDQERARPETRRRFEALFKAKGLSSVDLDSLRIKRGSSIKIDMESSFNAFSKLLEQRRPELVIIDSLATFHTKESNNAMEIQSVMEKLKLLREQFGCAFLFVHHLNKNEFAFSKEGQEPDIGLLAGSIAIPAAAETVFIVRKRPTGEGVVYHCKSTMAKKVSPFEFSVKDTDKGVAVIGIK